MEESGSDSDYGGDDAMLGADHASSVTVDDVRVVEIKDGLAARISETSFLAS